MTERITLSSGSAADIARTDGATRSLVIVPDIAGLRPLFSDMCESVAARTGWSVGAFEPFPDPTIPGLDHPDGFAARSAALAELDDSRVLGDAVELADAMGCDAAGLIGFCMGGMYAHKAAATARFDRIGSFYGMIRLPEAWQGPGQQEPLDALAGGDPSTVIAVVGTADNYTPPDDVAALRELGVTVVSYEGAEHGFVHDPSRPTHRPDDAADAWDRVLDFLGA